MFQDIMTLSKFKNACDEFGGKMKRGGFFNANRCRVNGINSININEVPGTTTHTVHNFRFTRDDGKKLELSAGYSWNHFYASCNARDANVSAGFSNYQKGLIVDATPSGGGSSFFPPENKTLSCIVESEKSPMKADDKMTDGIHLHCCVKP